MTIRNLQYLFAPRSIAVIGASQRPASIGAIVLDNLLAGGFEGPVLPVNPKYAHVAGIPSYPSVAELPVVPDLAVICTPPSTVPSLIDQLGKRGTRAALVLTAGLNAIEHAPGTTAKDAMLAAARPHLLRILGPNCVGLIVPERKLNASFAHTQALPGKVAFVSQSGALVTSVLDWAKSRGIGFSKFISLGESADVDFGDVIDYLASDNDTHAVLLYMEAVTAARKFMSAARAAARNKPVLVLKAGRAPEAAKAAMTHTGALAAADDVYDAAIRRAGMLRVFTTEDLFDTVETLARARPLRGDRIAIMSNGGGPAVLAVDALCLGDGRLAPLSADTLTRLDGVLPPTWSRANPVDLIGDAPVERYVEAMRILLDDRGIDALLFIHSPTAVVASSDIAAAVAPIAATARINVIGCWLGGDAVLLARRIFAQAGLPSYDTPESAVHAFLQMVRYQRNQQLLMEVPSSISREFTIDHTTAKRVLGAVRDEGRSVLSEVEAKELLAAYGVAVVDTRIATSPDEAAQLADAIGYPVAVKVLSPDITHKSDVGGVALNLDNAQAVREAAQAIQRNLQQLKPGATLDGFSVQAMVQRAGAHELIAGISFDAVFGPVILIGQGGIAVEVTADRAIGLPPLNMVLARDMLARTRVARLLAGYRNRPPADEQAICRTLVQLSHLVSDLPEVLELDINPLLADQQGVIALDARIRIRSAGESTPDCFSIRPYPEELEERITWRDQPLLLRPIRPEDAAAHLEFFKALDPEDVRFRIFMRLRELAPSQLSRLTQIDYDREMAFIASRERATGEFETIGVVRGIVDPDNERAEFAIIVRSDMKGQGLGRVLMDKLIRYFRERGTKELVGEALRENKGLQKLVASFGFTIAPSDDHEVVTLRFPLQP